MTMTTTRTTTPDSSSYPRWSGTPGEFRPPRYESPHARLSDGSLYPSAGNKVVRWIEQNLVHGEGDVLGQPVRLGAFWRYVIRRIYEYDPADGHLLHDRVLLGIPKGNAKTEGAADIGLAELCGPLAPTAPNVPLSATSWDQANKLLGAARYAIVGDEGDQPGPLARFFRRGVQILDDRILHPTRPGKLYRVAAVGGTNDGGLPTCHIGDEIHELEGEDRERLWIVQGKSLRKRQVPRPFGLSGALQIGITTAGDSKDSLLGRLYEHGVAVATGELADPGFLFLWWEASAGWDLDDDEQLVQAILEANPAAGDFLPVRNLVASFLDPTVPRHEFERYNLNRWISSPKRWIADDVVRARRAGGPPADKSPVVLGFHGSYNRTSTALVGVGMDGHLFTLAVWEPQTGQAVPRMEVDGAIAAAMKRWKVVGFAVDPPGWTSELEGWEREWRGVVIRFESNVPARMGPACDRFRAAMLEGARISHDADPRLERHIRNAQTHGSRFGDLITKDYPDSPRDIAAARAAVLAYDTLTTVFDPKGNRKDERFHGMIA